MEEFPLSADSHQRSPRGCWWFQCAAHGCCGGKPFLLSSRAKSCSVHTQQQGEEVISQENEQPLAFPWAGATSAHGTARVGLGDLGDPFNLDDSLMTQSPCWEQLGFVAVVRLKGKEMLHKEILGQNTRLGEICTSGTPRALCS